MQALNIPIEATVGPAKERTRGNPLFALPAETMKSLVPGEQFVLRVHVNNPGAAALPLSRVWLETPGGESWNVTAAPASPAPGNPASASPVPAGTVPASLGARQARDVRFNVRSPRDAAPTRPYFSR